MQKISGNIVDIHSRKIIKGHLYYDSHIQKIEEDPEVTENHYIIPGFIDAHVHIESSMLIPSEFARLAVLHGTVATISDPHEIGNVMGKKGVRYMIDNGKQTPFKFHFGAPSCVPATQFETAGAVIDSNEIREILSWPEVNYLAEMMNYPGVYYKDPEVLEKIRIAKELGKVIDGHLPGIVGEMMIDYVKHGISTDHECFTLEEALAKINHGMKIIIREGSAAKNFEALWTLLNTHPEMVMFCSDDKHPNDLVISHINALAKRAIAKGCDLFSVLRATSINVIEHYSMNVGSLKIGDPADFCIVEDVVEFEVKATYIDGKCVAENYQSKISSTQSNIINHFDCVPLQANDFELKAEGKHIQVIVVEDGQLITQKETHEAVIENGQYVSSTENDLLKIAVINRYKPSKPAVAFIKNIGLISGAIASCVAHDSHNIIVVGCNDEDMAKACNLIIQEKGGVSLSNGSEFSIVSLPVAGIMSNSDAYQVAEAYDEIDLQAKRLGTNLKAPFMTLSFCALLVIPKLKLSDLGLFDGEKFEFTNLSI